MSRPHHGACTVTILRRDSALLPTLRVEALDTPSAAPVPLALEPVVVGSSEECEIVLSDPRVSRRHAALHLTEHGIVLRDLGSKNGTFIGPTQVIEAFLARDVVVSVGESRLA